MQLDEALPLTVKAPPEARLPVTQTRSTINQGRTLTARA
jgi:hypothetical protein